MPRTAKGPRLYLRKGRTDQRTGKPLPDIWFIRDGQAQRSTGYGASRLPEAERELADYIASKWSAPPDAASRRRDPAQVLVAEVLALYAHERAPALASDPKSTAGFVKHLAAWWGDKRLSDVRRSTCQAYVQHRTGQTNSRAKEGRPISDQTARRELEVLSAAIGYWHGEDKLSARPEVWLPPKPESPRDALTRAQAARLLRAAMGWRWIAPESRWERRGGSARANRAHLRRFLLIGLYTGTRHAVITRLLWEEAAQQAWVDLDGGMIYRRGARETEHRTKRRPVVKLPRRLLAHLRRWRRLDAERDTRIVSVIHHGGQALSSKIRRSFAACVADAGLSDEITPHWLRHTAATWLMQAGVDPWEAGGYLGMTAATLEKHYGHHAPTYQSGPSRAIAKGNGAVR